MNAELSIENDFIKARIAPKGAELRHLELKASSTDFMWTADEGVWPRVAPLLFPIVGRLKNDTYLWEGNAYQMKQHGFLRDQEFDLIDYSTDTVRLKASYNQETLQLYPFQWEIELQYTCTSNSLAQKVVLKNIGESVMPYSLGFHPGFRIPMDAGKEYSDYQLKFSDDEELERYLIDGGLISDEREQVSMRAGVLNLNKDLFMRDALVMKSMQSSRVRIECQDSPRALELEAHGFPFYGIWAQKGANFVCLEPWHGIADSVNATQDFASKEGIKKLNSMEVFSCEIIFHLF